MVADAANLEKQTNIALVAEMVSVLLNDSLIPPAKFDLVGFRDGYAKGPIVPCNLSVLTRLIGTRYEPHWERCILVIEDIGEYYYAIDRMMLHLRQSQLATRISGIVIGDFTETLDNEVPWGKNIPEIVLDHFSAFQIPIAAGLPCGHGEINIPLVIGQEANFSVNGAKALLRLESERWPKRGKLL